MGLCRMFPSATATVQVLEFVTERRMGDGLPGTLSPMDPLAPGPSTIVEVHRINHPHGSYEPWENFLSETNHYTWHRTAGVPCGQAEVVDKSRWMNPFSWHIGWIQYECLNDFNELAVKPFWL